MNVIIDEVSFSIKGQIVIPRRLRKEFEIEEGTRAYIQSTSEGILIKPLTKAHIKRMRGSLKGKGVLKCLIEDRESEREK
ncbi:MAG: AbrB/MazE/SpoVT family DNA-binding domain-containing protein [Verrucomicrobiota bacterium]|nr:AbrB/MazE/SpoVT family DNA-binding domain-containing protein [Verrucomicrobiota bacterium]